MSSWEMGLGGAAPLQSGYNYKASSEGQSFSEIHHNNSTNPPPFRGDGLPMPISSHIPPLDSGNLHHIHHHQISAPTTPSHLYGHASLLPLSLGGHGASMLQPQLHSTPPSIIEPPHLQQHQHYPHPGGPGGVSLLSQHLSHPGLHLHHSIKQDPYVPLKLPTATSLPTVSANIPIPPHTPQGAPVSHPFGSLATGADKGPDLPHHLVEQGWTKCWSKREARYYFFNCNTNESIWDLPLPGRLHHGHIYDPVTDPLGIQHGGIHSGLKRRASSGEHVGSPPAKRIIVSGPWDLEVSSNVYSAKSETPRHDLFPPHPQVELLRYQLLVKLRQCYQQACKSREQIDAPNESLNRWLMEQKINDLKMDPLFPCCENPEGIISLPMFNEIMTDVPMKLLKPRFTGDARKQLAKFAEACKKAIETKSTSSDHRKIVKWRAEETFTWLRDSAGLSYDDFQQRMVLLKREVLSPVHEAAKSSVEGICKKISVLSRQYSQKSREAHLALFIDPQNVKKEYPLESGRYRSQAVICGEYQFKEEVLPPPQKALVDFLQYEKEVLIKHKTEHVRISSNYMHKLDALYKYHNLDDKKGELFMTRVYCLLKRYNAFCNEFNPCQTTQGSIPTPVFESIQRNFGVTFECFSSPFNCYFRNFCSAFPDIDGFFGSSGSFLEYRPISGSFQMNPPLCNDLIDAAITHVESLLAGTQEPMSFVLFLPEFENTDDSTSPKDSIWIKRVQNSVWKREQVTIPPFEHDYRSGSQHIVPKSEIAVRSKHATVVFWLQNEAGFEEWKPTNEKMDSLVDSYRPGRERERDRQDLLAPERQNPHQADKAVAAAKAIGNTHTTNSGLPPPPILPTNA